MTFYENDTILLFSRLIHVLYFILLHVFLINKSGLFMVLVKPIIVVRLLGHTGMVKPITVVRLLGHTGMVKSIMVVRLLGHTGMVKPIIAVRLLGHTGMAKHVDLMLLNTLTIHKMKINVCKMKE